MGELWVFEGQSVPLKLLTLAVFIEVLRKASPHTALLDSVS